MKYTFEKKLNIVSRVKAGCPIRQLAKENNLHENKILDWVRLYDRYGVDILRKRPKIKPTSDFKEQVVREILEKGLPLSHALIKYRISRIALEGWVRTVRKHGYAEFIYLNVEADLPKLWQDLRKKEPQTELEKLQAENLRLRAENALLKK
ncbi:transposase [uncultured Bacteroides sp.]|uniref:transposase n=1 Tax=uncultured Bacteroides sp. TaxID=162156 RepID=UPI0025F342A3|nr:transposase [uncultured Bacteroides sp.]